MLALRDLVLLEEISAEVQLESGLYLPTVNGNPDPEVRDSSTKFKRGRVRSVGPTVKSPIEIGDTVLFSPVGCVHVRDSKEVLTIVTEAALLVKD